MKEIIDQLLPYQREWIRQRRRLKIGLWARQTGKDHTAEAVLHSRSRPGTLWLILAAGERQALESLAKAKEWAQQARFRVDDYSECRPRRGARLTSAQIRWQNGARLMALPANADTVRGYSANVILTEFAFHERPHEIWQAIYPSITNPMRGGRKQLRIISTPNGKSNKFAQIWHGSNEYFKSRIAIHDAIKAGLPLDASELERGLDDDEAWQQEYLCEFMDGSSVLLPYELIATCEHPEATEAATPDTLLRGNQGQLFAGVDFGRKRHLTVCWIVQKVGEMLWTREVLVLPKMSTPEQVEILKPRLAKCARTAIDYTGNGVGFGDYLVKALGEWAPGSGKKGRVELCQFTSGVKGELFPKLRAAFESGTIRIPSSAEIREDLHGITRSVSPFGHITYRALESEDGHSDRCTALALAIRALTNGPVSVGATTVSGAKGYINPVGLITMGR